MTGIDLYHCVLLLWVWQKLAKKKHMELIHHYKIVTHDYLLPQLKSQKRQLYEGTTAFGTTINEQTHKQ